MIVHDLECTSGHLFERAVDAADTNRQRCPLCRKKATVVFLPKRQSHTPNTVYYENAKGEKLYPWDSRDLPKTFTDAGFTRREVSAFERNRFERRTRQEMNAEASRKREEERREYESERAERHTSLREESRNWDSYHRDLAEHAMAQEDSGYSERYDSEFHIGLD